MAKILDMPKLSPTMEEGVLQAWHKNEGDSVNVDDLLAEVETDKATMEFRAFDKGTLLKILVPAGTNVKLGQAVAIIGQPGEDVSQLAAGHAGDGGGGAAAPAPAPAAAAAPAAPQTPGRISEPEKKPDTRASVETLRPAARAQAKAKGVKGSLLDRTSRDVEIEEDTANGRVIASPYVRKVARERGIDLSGAHGSGEHGRI